MNLQDLPENYQQAIEEQGVEVLLFQVMQRLGEQYLINDTLAKDVEVLREEVRDLQGKRANPSWFAVADEINAEGKSKAEIARVIGKSRVTVTNYLNKTGIYAEEQK
ncbi:hypothetical protein [Vibrio agarivorans]|uniref:hypothetical protein n=1 Tax=Vibrio agarivorans TaxID=153622 RepID=UPI0025B2B74B|nr:hypothetical protein [Vibrio agarivorans]MDN3659948.1 hypothetical protein [Vibrio agarivorans]